MPCPLLNSSLCLVSALVPATITATTQRLTVFNSNPHFQEKGSVYLLLCCESCLKGRMVFFHHCSCLSVFSSMERSLLTLNHALNFSTQKRYHRASVETATRHYVSTIKVNTTLPPCMTETVVYHCTILRIYSVLEMDLGPKIQTG